MEIENRKRFLINFSYVAVIGILVYIFARFLISYLLPFVVATLIASLMQRPAEFLGSRLKIKKNIIAAVFSALVYFLVGFLAVLLIYRLSVFLGSLINDLPKIFDKIIILAEKLNNILQNAFPKNYNASLKGLWESALERTAVTVTAFLSSIVTNTAKSAPSFLFSSVVALVASCYIAKDYDRLLKFIKELSGEKITSNLVRIKNILFECVFKLIKGYCILSGLTYLEILIGLIILRVKYAFLIALLIAVVDILPVLGAGTVLIPWAVLTAVFGNIPLSIGIAVLYITVILLRNFLEPKVIGTQIGINPLFTLLAMFVGLRLFGVVGLFSFPVILIVTIKYYKT